MNSGTKPSKIREEPASSCDASLPKCLLLASPCAFALHLPRLVRTETRALPPSLVLTVPLRCPQQHCSDHLNSAGPVSAPGFSLGLGQHFTDIHTTLLYLTPGSFMQYNSNIVVVVVVLLLLTIITITIIISSKNLCQFSTWSFFHIYLHHLRLTQSSLPAVTKRISSEENICTFR